MIIRALRQIIPVFAVIISYYQAVAQIQPPPCATNPIAADYCESATPICNLNGYCGNTSSFYTVIVSPSNPVNENYTPLGNVFCATLQNNSWLKFIADSTTAVFNVWGSNCTGNKGIQMQIYHTTDCYNYTPVSNCWNPGSPTNGTISAINLTVGETYYFMIDGRQGDVCDYVIACDVGVVTAPAVSLPKTICAGASTTVAVTGGLTYTWSSNPPDPTMAGQQTNAVLTVTPAVTTVYTVTVSNTGVNTFCTADTTILSTTVTINNVSAQAAVSPSTCNQPNGSVTITGTGGTGTYTYIWNTTPAQTTATASGLAAGIYTVTVTSGSCDHILSAIVPSIPPPVAAITASTPSYCNQNNGTAIVQASGGTPPFAYAWNSAPLQYNDTLQNVGPGNYTVTVTDSTNCTATQTVVINADPGASVSLAPLSSTCQNVPPITLTGGTPAGGTYSGAGVSGNIFDPSVSGPGTFAITFSFTDIHGCTNSASQSIQVFAPPSASLQPFAAVCANAPGFILSGGAPAGGTYSGPGIYSGVFLPKLTFPGTHTITYVYKDQNGCADTATRTITVNALPNVTLAPFTGLCVNAPPLTLTGGSPAGGTYFGTGVSGGVFSPSVTGLGTHQIFYTYTNSNGCSDTASQPMVVAAIPAVVYVPPVDSICENAGNILLSGGTPSGGTYTGVGIVSNSFAPSLVGPGFYMITYTYTDQYGCSESDIDTLAVIPSPLASLAGFADMCLNDTALLLSGGIPTGGVYQGNGISGGYFDPAAAGAGIHAISYIYVDPTGCSDTAYSAIKVHALPVVSLALVPSVCADTPPVILNGGSPAGGTYSGPGVVSTTFYPSQAGPGLIPVTYAYKDSNNCLVSVTKNIEVGALPIPFNVLGGGVICDEGLGTHIYIDGSETSVQYSLLHNSQYIGFPLAGNGDTLDFGIKTDSGTYVVYAVNMTTGCDTMMPGSAVIRWISSPDVHLADSGYVCENTELILDAGNFSPDSVDFIWSDNSTARTLVITEPGTYWVKVGLEGCYGTDSILVKPCGLLWFPNVFTPNDDSKNDRFLPKITGDVIQYHVETYNRWGKLVYRSDDMYEGWDGTLNNSGSDCSEGVYYFVATYRGYGMGEVPTEAKATGSVTLLR